MDSGVRGDTVDVSNDRNVKCGHGNLGEGDKDKVKKRRGQKVVLL